MVILPDGIELRDEPRSRADIGAARFARAGQIVTTQIEIIVGSFDAEAPPPIVRQLEEAFAKNTAAQALFAEPVAVRVEELLLSKRRRNIELTREEALAEFEAD